MVLYFFTGAAATAPSKAAPVSSTDITYGPKDAKLTVIEYSDFQCPFCAVYAPILDQLRQKYGDQVQFVYRFYPLSNHKWATIAAKVAYAAYLQGKFWEMHDLLFKNQDEWAGVERPATLLRRLRREPGPGHRPSSTPTPTRSPPPTSSSKQAAEGKAAGVTHTPWFVVGDKSVLPRSFEQFDKVIQEAL